MSVTLITPTYPGRPWEVVERCIASVEAQTYQDTFHLICSDGPNPVAREAIQPHLTSRRSYHELSEACGEWGNRVREYCLPLVDSEYVGFVDDDNVVFPDYCARMVDALERGGPEVGFAICRIVHRGPLAHWHGEPPQVLLGVPVAVGNTDPLQVTARTASMREVGWLSQYGYYADGRTFEELARRFGFVQVPKILGIHI